MIRLTLKSLIASTRAAKGGARFYTSFSRSQKGLLVGKKIVPYALIGVAGLGLGTYTKISIESESNKANELAIEDSISVDSSISPLPTKLTKTQNPNLHESFTMLGNGVRTVTFVRFKVYGIGLYIADRDVKKAKEVLSDRNLQKLGINKTLQETLNDGEASGILVSHLLDSGVRFAVRICPVRNTDFNHLRDGLIKSILAHPKSKQSREVVDRGLEQMRQVFTGRKGSVPKNHVLWLELLSRGELEVSYEDTSKNTLVDMGTVIEPMVGKLLFLQYLSGKKPLSEPLRKSCADGFVAL